MLDRPRGIVAAAVSSLFALTLQRSGYQGADRLVTVVFAIIIGTVVLQSLTSGMMARWLRVQQQKPRGVLIVGANSVARMLAQALIKLNVPVIVTDSSWEYYRGRAWTAFRPTMATPTRTRRELSRPEQYRPVLALSQSPPERAGGLPLRPSLRRGSRVCHPFGGAAEGRGASAESSRFRRHEILFNQEATYGRLSSLLAGGHHQGNQIERKFRLAGVFEKHKGVIPLFSQKEDGSLQPISAGSTPAMPCTLIALVQDENPSPSVR